MSKKKISHRDVPERDAWYMGLAFWIASKSKDPETQNGAIIVVDNLIIGTGYNGPPASYTDSDLDWGRPNKYDHIIHAEENALIHSVNIDKISNSTMYITGPPCKSCTKRMVHLGVKKAIYFPCQSKPGSMMGADWDVIKDIAKRGSLDLVEFRGNLNWMRDRISHMTEVLGIF